MLLGPVFHAELLTTARRARYYVIRTGYGLIVLSMIYLTFRENASGPLGESREMTIQEMADFGRAVFSATAILQAVAVVLLTPALVGGTIADERQRKTLHYLLASRLGGLEIVAGKLAARLLHVFVLVAMGLPVVSLTGLFGGVDFPVLLMTYAGTLTTAYFLASVSILVSVYARRPREAVVPLYIYELVWLTLPPLFFSTMRYWPAPWPAIDSWVRPWIEYVAMTGPFYLLTLEGSGNLAASAAWVMGLQVACGTACVLIAAARLRPASQGDGQMRGLAGKLASIVRKRRWLPRPACGEDGMLWKERFVARTGGLTKAVLSLLTLGLVGLAGYFLVGFYRPALAEMWARGYFDPGPARAELNIYLRFLCTTIFVIGSLSIAASAAGGLTSEREEDTWISLVATPLPGGQILRAKMIGAIWTALPLGLLMVGLWAVGLSVGAIHPLGVAACLVELAVFSWFLAALGTACSLGSKNSMRSLALTMTILIFVNGGYLFCCIPFSPTTNTSLIFAGLTPVLFTMSLVSEENLRNIWNQGAEEMGAASLLGVIVYLASAASLTGWVVHQFDAVADRPDRSRQALTDRQYREKLRGPVKGISYRDELR